MKPTKKHLTVNIECEPGYFLGSLFYKEEWITCESTNEDDVLQFIRAELLTQHGLYEYDYELTVKYS